MKTILCVALFVCALAAGPSDVLAEEEPAVLHAKPIELPESGLLGTRMYAPSPREKPYYDKLGEKERITGNAFSDYEITGKTGEYVAWFGIVREIVEVEGEDRTDLLVEMKYFDGLTDLHLQLVSFTGGGDFRARVPGKGLGIEHLSLVLVYGTVKEELGSREHFVPLLDAEFVVHWDWGLFTFMNYGKPHGNQSWRKLCKISVDDIYSSRPGNAYYEARLGVRRDGKPLDKDGIPEPDLSEEIEEVAHTVFNALKADDFQLVARLVATAADVRWVADHMKKNGLDEVEESLEKEGGPEGVAAKSLEKVKSSFAKTREDAAAEFDWSQASFDGITRDDSKMRAVFGIATGVIEFLVKVGDDRYAFQLKDCGRLERGWVLTDRIQFMGKRE